MKRKLFSLVVACLFFAFAGAQTVYYVNGTTGNDNNNGTSESSAFRTIEKAVNMTQENTPTIIYLEANGTFNFDGMWPEGYAYVDFGSNKDVEVIGDNTTIQGANKPGNEGGQSSRIMRGGDGTSLKVSGVNFVNGRQIEYMLGGAIYFGGNKLELENCRFINNEAGSGGSAIGSRGKQVIVNNCYFDGNYTIGNGAIGAAIMHCGVKQDMPSEDYFLKVSNSTFHRNTMTPESRGPAIGIYDQSTSGKYTCTLSRVEVTNCTFFENSISNSNYEGVIDLTGADEVDIYIINNTFHNDLAAISIPFFLGETTFINNVVYSGYTAIVSSVDENYREFTAYNNVLLGGETAVNENMTEASLKAGNSNGNIVATTQNMAKTELGLSPELVDGNLIITSANSILIDAGMDDSSAITGENMIPATDARGYGITGKKDIGAYEYEGGTNINFESISNNQLAEIAYNGESITVKNSSNQELTLRIVSIDGKLINSTNFTNELTISKGEVQGFVILVLTNGSDIQTEKVVL